MPIMVRVENYTEDQTHRYSDRGRHQFYVWPPGTIREVPEDVAAAVCTGHPYRLRVLEPEVEEAVEEAVALVNPGDDEDPDSDPDPDHTRHYFKADGVCKCGETGEANTRPLVNPE